MDPLPSSNPAVVNLDRTESELTSHAAGVGSDEDERLTPPRKVRGGVITADNGLIYLGLLLTHCLSQQCQLNANEASAMQDELLPTKELVSNPMR
jgi:hypothetical protein